MCLEAETKSEKCLGVMEVDISPKAEVAELELQAVIGFNGEAMSTSGRAGSGPRGVRCEQEPWDTGCDLAGSVGLVATLQGQTRGDGETTAAPAQKP